MHKINELKVKVRIPTKKMNLNNFVNEAHYKLTFSMLINFLGSNANIKKRIGKESQKFGYLFGYLKKLSNHKILINR